MFFIYLRIALQITIILLLMNSFARGYIGCRLRWHIGGCGVFVDRWWWRDGGEQVLMFHSLHETHMVVGISHRLRNKGMTFVRWEPPAPSHSACPQWRVFMSRHKPEVVI